MVVLAGESVFIAAQLSGRNNAPSGGTAVLSGRGIWYSSLTMFIFYFSIRGLQTPTIHRDHKKDEYH